MGCSTLGFPVLHDLPELLKLISIKLVMPSNHLILSSPSPRDSQESSPAPQFKSISSLVLSLLYSPTLTSVHDYWENHGFDSMDLCQQSHVSAF